MGKYKTKAIQTDLGIIKRIQNPVHIKSRGISRTMTYLKPKEYSYWKLWHIQNPRLIQTSTMSNIYDEAFCENS